MANYVHNICVDEDGIVGIETKSAGTFDYMWNLLEGKQIGWNFVTYEEVVTELDKWVVSVKEEKDVDVVKLDKKVVKFKESLTNMYNNKVGFMLTNVWGIECDTNFGVLYSTTNYSN